MNIHQGSKAITLSLEDYIISAASSTDIPIHRPVYTPLSSVDPLFNHKKSPLLTDVRLYQSIIGQFIFIANAGRLDMAYVVSILSSFLKEPRQVHMQTANRVLQYLYTTWFRCLKYSNGTSVALTIYSDAATCSQYDLPYSTGGYCTKLAGGTITWSSKRITSCVCLSSTQAEYISASNAVREIEWLTNLINHMGIQQKRPILYVDNTPVIQLAKYPVFHSRTKHIAIHYHNIKACDWKWRNWHRVCGDRRPSSSYRGQSSNPFEILYYHWMLILQLKRGCWAYHIYSCLLWTIEYSDLHFAFASVLYFVSCSREFVLYSQELVSMSRVRWDIFKILTVHHESLS